MKQNNLTLSAIAVKGITNTVIKVPIYLKNGKEIPKHDWYKSASFAQRVELAKFIANLANPKT